MKKNIFQRLFFKDAQKINGSIPKINASLFKGNNHNGNGSQFVQQAIGDFNLKNAELVSTVFTCINILSSNVSRLPLLIYNDDGSRKTVAKDHPYFPTLRFKPTSYFSYQNWCSLIVSHLGFYGNAYALINGKELQIIHPDLVEVAMGIDDIWYKIEGIETPIPSSSILHFKTLSKDGLVGLNPIQSLRVEIQIQTKSEKTVEKFYDNRASSPIYLQPIEGVGGLDKGKVKELTETWKEIKDGIDSRGIFVCPPLMGIKELKLNADDIKFLESANYTEASIASLFGIPISMLGKGNSNYQNVEQQLLNFKHQTLGSYLNIIRAELENKLLSVEERIGIDGPTMSIEFDVRGLIETDIATRATVAKLLKDMGALSPNEVRREFNLEPIDNSNMSAHYQQMQYVQVEKLGEAPPSGSVSYLNENK
jgi:HK97 family phage portal protein